MATIGSIKKSTRKIDSQIAKAEKANAKKKEAAKAAAELAAKKKKLATLKKK
jgi:hypothetical protein